MPKYKIQTPDGRVVTIEGDSPPTESELEQLTGGGEAPKPTAEMRPMQPTGMWDRARQYLTGLASDRRIARQEHAQAKEAGLGVNMSDEELLATVLGIGSVGPLAGAAAAAPVATAASVGAGTAVGNVAHGLGVQAGEQIGPGVGEEIVGPAAALAGFTAGGAAPGLAIKGVRALRGAPPATPAAAAPGAGPAPQPPAAPAAPQPQPPAGGGPGVTERIRMALGQFEPELKKIGWELAGRRVGAATGIPGAPLVGGRIGRLMHRIFAAEKDAILGRGGTEVDVEAALAAEVMKAAPGLSREQALSLVRTPGVTYGPAPTGMVSTTPTVAAPPAPRAPLSDEAKAAIDAAVAAGGRRMTMSPEDAARVSQDAAEAAARRAPKSRLPKPVAAPNSQGTTTRPASAPAAEPAAPLAGLESKLANKAAPATEADDLARAIDEAAAAHRGVPPPSADPRAAAIDEAVMAHRAAMAIPEPTAVPEPPIAAPAAPTQRLIRRPAVKPLDTDFAYPAKPGPKPRAVPPPKDVAGVGVPANEPPVTVAPAPPAAPPATATAPPVSPAVEGDVAGASAKAPTAAPAAPQPGKTKGPTGRTQLAVTPSEVKVKRVPVESSAFNSYGYNKGKGILDVEHTDGRVYRYYDVTAADVAKIEAASSKGKAIGEVTRGKTATRLGTAGVEGMEETPLPERKPEGSIGPYEGMPPSTQLKHVIRGNKPAFLDARSGADIAKLAKEAKRAGLPYTVTEYPGGTSENSHKILVGKDRASLDRLTKALESGDDAEIGRALGYSDKDIEAFMGGHKPMPAPARTATVTGEGGKYKVGDTTPSGQKVLEVDDQGRILVAGKGPNKGLVGKSYGDKGPRTLKAPTDAPKPGSPQFEAMEVGVQRAHNVVQELTKRIAPEVEKTIGLKGFKVELEVKGATRYDPKTKTVTLNVGNLSDPKILTHELAHSVGLHEFPAVVGNRSYYPAGFKKTMEVDPALDLHTTANIGERAKVSAEEHAFQTAMQALDNNPKLIEAFKAAQKAIDGIEDDAIAQAFKPGLWNRALRRKAAAGANTNQSH